MHEAKHEGGANYWKTRYVLLEAKNRRADARNAELLDVLKDMCIAFANAKPIPPMQETAEAVLTRACAAVAKATTSESGAA